MGKLIGNLSDVLDRARDRLIKRRRMARGTRACALWGLTPTLQRTARQQRNPISVIAA